MSLFLRQNRFGEDIRFGLRLFNFKPQAKIQKSTSKIHLHICLELFWTVYSCKQCLICAYFSPDADENVFFGEINIVEDCFKLKCLNDGFVSYKHCFLLHKMLTDGLEWCGLLVDYCDVFISCLDSHSDGTHSLQRIHWWVSDVMLHFSKSVLMKKQTHLHLGWSKCPANCHFWVNDSFNTKGPVLILFPQL